MKLAKTFRLPVGLIQALEEEADRTAGGNRTTIVEQALRSRLNVSEEGSAAAAARGTPDPAVADMPQVPPEARETVDLPNWMSEKTTYPLALCRRFIATKRVTIDDEPVSDLVVPRDMVDQVCLDGIYVSSREPVRS